MNKETQLSIKLNKEYSDYINKLKEKGDDAILHNCYEITLKQAIINCINHMDTSTKDINTLLKIDNILDNVYNRWLDSDENLHELMEDFVIDEIDSMCVAEVKSEQNKDNQNSIDAYDVLLGIKTY